MAEAGDLSYLGDQRSGRAGAQQDTLKFAEAALTNSKREGLLLAVRARWVALAVTAVTLPIVNPNRDVIYYVLMLGLFALIGWAQLKVGRIGRSPLEISLILCDLALLTFLSVVPNPWSTVNWPIAMQFRFDSFIYFFVFLATATLAYSWRTVVAMGVWTSALWAIGFGWVYLQPATHAALSERVRAAVGSDVRLFDIIDPAAIGFGARFQQIIVFLIVAMTLALAARRSNALLISHAGIALPFLLGILLAWPLFRSYAPNGIAFAGFAMFMGIALSVTAFPVLLRILEERGDSATPIGLIAITCAALSDATAWGMLGAIVALVKSQSLLGVTVSLALALIFAWLIVARARAWFAHRIVEEVREPQWMVALVLLILICALFTEAIGLHAMFGAFLAGIAVSRNTALRTLVEHKIEPFAAVLLLPVFFASTGLRTRIDLLSGSEWLLCLGIVGVATLGKLGGTAIAARWSGLSRIDALRLGSLMNTRGLMELIVLGLGYDLGIISQALYAILVLVAIITTVMTGPLLTAIDRFEARQRT